MKRNLAILIAVIIVAVGAYAIFHKSNKPTPSSTNNSTKQTSSSTVNNSVLTTKTDPSLGQYLADPSGKALYIYNADTSGVSNCTGSCLSNWPIYQATTSATNLPAGVSTIKRSDNGQTQYTYNGMPLYYFTGDSAGQVTGNGVENFSVAKPSTASTQTQPSSGSSAPYSY